MKKSVLVCIFAAVIVAGLGVVPASQPASAAQNGQVVAGQYIVKLADGVDVSAAKDLGRLYGLTVHFTYSHAFHGFAAHIPDAQVARLQADPRIASIVADHPRREPAPRRAAARAPRGRRAARAPPP